MITVVSQWSSEGDNGEIEYKDGFQKHYSARGGSNWSGCMKNSEVMVKKKGEKSRCFILYASDSQERRFRRMIKRPRCPLH
jgi:hypothetical protein